jgi:hypothetical protein
LESTSTSRPLATLGDIAAQHSANGQLLLPPPPATRRGRAAVVFGDRWNRLRNDLRLMAEDHVIATPLIGLAAGFLAGRILHAALRRPRQQSRGW